MLRQARAQVSLPGNRRTISALMAITPEEFGRVAWFRADLLPAHWHHYLNRLAADPKAMLLSSSIAEEFELKLGDTILVTWSSQDVVDGVVVGFIDHWPAFLPVDDSRTPPRLVVANFPYMRAKMAVEPYEVWARREPRSSSAEIYQAIEDRELDVVAMTDATQQVVEAKNDPLLQGTNGVLTLGFSVAMLISIVGFVMYWVLTLRSRTLQFGVLRAIGMSSERVLVMLVVEQVLITGSAIVAGMVIGRVAALLFVPLLQVILRRRRPGAGVPGGQRACRFHSHIRGGGGASGARWGAVPCPAGSPGHPAGAQVGRRVSSAPSLQSSLRSPFVLTAAAVSRSFQVGGSTVHALREVDLRVPRSRLTILQGPSGSGKTTLINILGALDYPSGGQVEFEHLDIVGLSDHEP